MPTPEEAIWGYQISIGGKLMLATDATRDQLLIALKEAIDVIEELDDSVRVPSKLIEDWRSGKNNAR